MGSPLRTGGGGVLSHDAVSSPPSWVGRVRCAIIQWCVDRARVTLLAHEARGVRSPTLADVVLRGGSSKDDTVRTRKKWQVVALLRNKEGRPAKAEVCFRFETVLEVEGAAICRRGNGGARWLSGCFRTRCAKCSVRHCRFRRRHRIGVGLGCNRNRRSARRIRFPCDTRFPIPSRLWSW